MNNIFYLILFFKLQLGVAYAESIQRINTNIEGLRGKNSVSIAFASCIKDFKPRIWQSLADKKPDIILLLGDNIYIADEYKELRLLEELYAANFSPTLVSELLSRTPTFAIWDDHDFGLNNSDSSFPFKSTTLKAFRGQWPNLPGPDNLKESIAFKISLDFMDILMTDNRTYRVHSRNESERVYFGDKQLRWIEAELDKSNKPLTIIASGNSLFPITDSPESFRNVPGERRRLIYAINRSSSKVIAISGDLHHALVSKHGHPEKNIYEVTSSPLTAPFRSMRDGQSSPAVQGVFAEDNNFGMLRIDHSENKLKIQAQIFDSHGNAAIDYKIK